MKQSLARLLASNSRSMRFDRPCYRNDFLTALLSSEDKMIASSRGRSFVVVGMRSDLQYSSHLHPIRCRHRTPTSEPGNGGGGAETLAASDFDGTSVHSPDTSTNGYKIRNLDSW